MKISAFSRATNCTHEKFLMKSALSIQKETYDIEYDFPFGRQELEGVALSHRLRFCRSTRTRAVSHWNISMRKRNSALFRTSVEPSAGVDRDSFLALICEAYSEDEAPDEKGKNGNATCPAFSSTYCADQVRGLSATEKTRSRLWPRRKRLSIFCGRT